MLSTGEIALEEVSTEVQSETTDNVCEIQPVLSDSNVCAGPEIVAPTSRQSPVFYTPYLGERITDLFLGGMSLYEVSQQDGMPSYRQIMRWVKEHNELRELLDGAREARAYVYEDAMHDTMKIAPTLDKDSVPGHRLKFDIANRLSETHYPDRFGKRTTIQGNRERPVSINVVTGFPDLLPHQMPPEIGSDGLIKQVAAEVVETPQTEEKKEAICEP